MEETRSHDTGFEEGCHEPQHQEIPGLLLITAAQEVSVPGGGVVLGTDLLGKHSVRKAYVLNGY